MMDFLGVRVVGPSEAYAVGFAEHLARLGYTFSTRCQHMTLVAHLSRWLAREGLDTAGLTVAVARRYIEVRAAAGYRSFLFAAVFGSVAVVSSWHWRGRMSRRSC